jgi:hypothetical protein
MYREEGNMTLKWKAMVALFCLGASMLWAAPNEKHLVTPWLTEEFMSLEPTIEASAFDLRIQSPKGESFEFTFDGHDIPYFDLFDLGSAVDGMYQFVLVARPILSEEANQWLNSKRRANEEVNVTDLRDMGFIGDTPLSFVGQFRIKDGLIWLPNSEVEEVQVSEKKRDDALVQSTEDKSGFITQQSPVEDADDPDRAQVFVTDVVVQGSICTGFDCVNGESFGFDTLRLKENNLRIHFQDTSVSASFPTNDWRIVINDTGNGGANFFAIEDSSAGTTPFKVLAGAGNNALYIDQQGDVGLNNSAPVVELHITDGDTPTMRLEQNGASGWTPQTWDVAGNESGFFVRDVTNGSQLAFRIKPGADQNSLFIDADNQIGLGTDSVSARLHLRTTTNEPLIYVHNARTGVTNQNDTPLYVTSESLVGIGTSSPEDDFHVKTQGAHAIFEDSTGTLADRNVFTLRNFGGSRFEISNTNLNKTWQISNPNNRDYLQFTFVGSGNAEMSIDENGDLEVHRNIQAGGTVNGSSDKNIKENFTAVNHFDILDKVSQIEITEWNYISDADATRHIGPMAQDFYSAFGVGTDEKHISMADINGVALASIKALNEKLEEKNSKIEDLEAQNKALQQQLSRIEAMLQRLVD